MTDTLTEFMVLLRRERDEKLRVLDLSIDRALRAGDEAELPAMRAERLVLLDLPGTIVSGDLAALVAQWPPSFPALPEWFSDPDSVPPRAPPLVVDCAPPEPVVIEDDPEPPSIETVRGWRVGFATKAYDDEMAFLDQEAAALRPPAHPNDLLPLRAQAMARRDARLAAIAAATTIDELKEL